MYVVMFPGRTKAQVLNTIVFVDTVDMMDKFKSAQWSPKCFGHYCSMITLRNISLEFRALD